MTQTKIGGAKAAATNKAKYGKDFYKIIGAKGGRNGCGPDYKGGFASNVALAAVAGRKGGLRGKAGLKFLREEKDCYVYENKDGEEVRFGFGESVHGSKDIDKIEKELEKDGRR